MTISVLLLLVRVGRVRRVLLVSHLCCNPIGHFRVALNLIMKARLSVKFSL